MPSKPKLGQNFLNDQSAIQRIGSAIGDCAGRTVVEIGPGKGAITGLLAARAGRVVAVELDTELAEALREGFSPEHVTIVNQDVLEFDFAAASAAAGERLLVVGNLPYLITSSILLKLADSHASLDRAVLMVQREVADRVTASPGSRDYGLLSVTVQLHGPVERLITLPPGAFSPPPEVHSSVFRWRFSPRFEELKVRPATFLRFLRQAFAQKRKTLANNLRAAKFPPEAVAEALLAASVEPMARAESLSIEALAAVWRNLEDQKEAIPLSAMASSKASRHQTR
jgi:16S rRNA (adenine1518-N6/adenine1519-N6)-dimethyltransferase